VRSEQSSLKVGCVRTNKATQFVEFPKEDGGGRRELLRASESVLWSWQASLDIIYDKDEMIVL